MFEFISLLFDSVWELFKLEYPGLGISIGAISIGALCVVLSFSWLSHITGASFSVRSLGSIRGGNNRNIKISEKRRGDSK